MDNIITTYVETIPTYYVGGISVTISRKLTPEHQQITAKIVDLIQKFNRGEFMEEMRENKEKGIVKPLAN